MRGQIWNSLRIPKPPIVLSGYTSAVFRFTFLIDKDFNIKKLLFIYPGVFIVYSMLTDLLFSYSWLLHQVSILFCQHSSCLLQALNVKIICWNSNKSFIMQKFKYFCTKWPVLCRLNGNIQKVHLMLFINSYDGSREEAAADIERLQPARTCVT